MKEVILKNPLGPNASFIKCILNENGLDIIYYKDKNSMISQITMYSQGAEQLLYLLLERQIHLGVT